MQARNDILYGEVACTGRGGNRPGLATDVLFKNESFSSAVICIQAGSCIPAHISTGQCLIYAVNGSGTCRSHGRVMLLNPGSYVYIPPNVEHTVEAIKEDLTVLVCLSHLIDPMSYFTVRIRERFEEHATEAG